MSLAFWVEVAVAALLLATVASCLTLHYRLRALRAAQAEMGALMRDFTGAMQRAESGLADLRLAGQEIGGELDDKLSAAHTLLDELRIMVRSGGEIADRLERGVLGPGGAAGAPATDGTGQAAAPRPAGTTPAVSESERELAEAMRRPR